MKRLFFLFSFLFLQIIHAQNLSIETLRKTYSKVNSDSVTCTKLYEAVLKIKNPDNIILGYQGAITAAMANYKRNKVEKLNLFIAGRKLIEQAIEADKDNIELRCLRFTIQSNCPKFLGYNKELLIDKNFIVENFSTINNTLLKSEISSFLFISNYLKEAEKKKIKLMLD